MTLAGAARDAAHPGGAVPRHRAAAGPGLDHAIPAPPPPSSRQTVAQPIEAQVIGVDKMIYMKSTSGNDGSYGLTVSFELGTNPDINTVNVNNRVQTALSQLPPEVQRAGCDGAEALLGDPANSSASTARAASRTRCSSRNYATINVLDGCRARRASGRRSLFGALDYSMRIWFDTNRLISPAIWRPPTSSRRSSRRTCRPPVGRIGARPTSDDAQFQLNMQTQGRLTTAEQFGDIVRARQPGRLGAARQGRGAGRARRQNQDTESRAQRQAGGRDRHLSRARRQRGADRGARAGRRSTSSSQRFPDGLKYNGHLRQHAPSSPTRSTRC